MHFDATWRTAVFLGPTLPRDTARTLLAANYYPPVKLGDLYKLLCTPVDTLLIIDGLFDGSTPVWHREILALLEAGIRVCGASSMGALRAAELHPYGMIGHGQVFKEYRDGVLNGDDEVALFHGPEALGYPKLSEPLVNLRHALNGARQAGIVNSEQESQLLERAKAQYFGDRRLDALPVWLEEMGGNSADMVTYLDSTDVDIKRRDAISLLQMVAETAYPQATVTADATAAQAVNADSTDVPAGTLTHQAAGTRHATRWYQRPSRYGQLMHGHELQHGAVWQDDGSLLPVTTLLNTLAAQLGDDDASREQAAEAAFLALALDEPVASLHQTGPAGSVSQPDDLQAAWQHRHGSDNAGELRRQLARNALERLDWEHRLQLNDRIEQSIACHAVQPSARCMALIALAQDNPALWPAWHAQRSAERNAACVLQVLLWAERQGIHPPDAESASEAQADLQHYRWLLSVTPAHLGYAYDPLMAVFRQWQMDDRLVTLL